MPRGPSAAARRAARRALDRRMALLRPALVEAGPPRGGWVQAVREALGMSLVDLASRMGTSDTTVLRLELAEREDRVQLDTLRRAADALGCDLVYALVPRRPLEEAVAAQAQLKARALLARVGHSMLLEDQQVPADVAREQFTERAALMVDQPGLWSDG